jgi:hypothetical protein
MTVFGLGFTPILSLNRLDYKGLICRYSEMEVDLSPIITEETEETVLS